VEIRDAEGRQVHRDMVKIAAQAAQVDKAGHKHFMAKEIFEQPTVLAQCLSHYTRDGRCSLPDVDIDFTGTDRLIMVACGTAYYACLVAKYWFEQWPACPAMSISPPSSATANRRSRPRPPRSSSASRGKPPTRSPRCAMRVARRRPCVAGQRAAILHRARKRQRLPILAGVEIGVASTKAFMNQLGALACLALVAGRQRGHLTPEREAELVKTLLSLPALINQALALEDQIRPRPASWPRRRSVLFLGRGPMFPMALEGALKLKEISYIHAEAYASGELKHGPIALVDNNLPVIVLAPRDALFDKTVSNMQEVMARDGKVWLVSDADGVRHRRATASGPRSPCPRSTRSSPPCSTRCRRS
jgi:glucosamine--fructose-6-phosphate aminotransferase (isomerizing)